MKPNAVIKQRTYSKSTIYRKERIERQKESKRITVLVIKNL